MIADRIGRRSHELPRVAIFLSAGAAGPREVLSAAEDLCEPLFVVDSSDPWLAGREALLDAFGCIDANGVEPDALASLLGEAGVSGITTFGEVLLRRAATTAAAMGLETFHSEPVAELVTNKALQRAALNAAGAGAQVEHVALGALEDVPAAFRELGPPCVLKPAIGSGSAFATVIENHRDVREAQRAFTPRRPPSGGFVLERLVRGVPHPAGWLADYVSVESSRSHGQTVHLCVSDRPALGWPLREQGLLLPSVLPPARARQVEEVATAALDALGVVVGMAHTQITLTLPEPTVVEVNGRLGGHVARNVQRVGGLDPVGEVLRLALGKAPAAAPQFVGFGATYHPVAPAAAERVLALPDVRQLRAVPGVWAAIPNVRVGATVDWVQGYDHRLYDVLIQTSSEAEMRQSFELLEGLVSGESRYTWRDCAAGKVA